MPLLVWECRGINQGPHQGQTEGQRATPENIKNMFIKNSLKILYLDQKPGLKFFFQILKTLKPEKTNKLYKIMKN